jgi:hypothetical protein
VDVGADKRFDFMYEDKELASANNNLRLRLEVCTGFYVW